MAIPNEGIPNFAERAEHSIGTAASTLRFTETRNQRVLRRFSLKEVCEFLGFERAFVNTWLEHPDGPKLMTEGRERTLSVHDIMRIRALAAPRPKGRRPTLFWRKPGDRLPVITICAQKGGTAKTSISAHLAQFANHYYGLRVGVIDCDPQASCSLYFASDQYEIAGMQVETFTTFMGVPAPNEPPLIHSDERLDTFWKRTPWPGLRLMPGGVEIQSADISMHFLARSKYTSHRRVYRLLRDALDQWSLAHPPKTSPEEFFDGSGRFRQDVFDEALEETFDLIILDTAPSLSLAQINAVVAADTLIVPQTMRGFDLSTLRIYLGSLAEYLRFIRYEDDPVNFAPLPSYVLPTIVSGDTDQRHVGELYGHDPEIVCPVYYGRSDAVANAAEEYQSIYEYQPPKTRRNSARAFLQNANAVCDAILSRAMPHLPPRGFANQFIEERFQGAIPPWTEEIEK